MLAPREICRWESQNDFGGSGARRPECLNERACLLQAAVAAWHQPTAAIDEATKSDGTGSRWSKVRL